MLIGAHVSTAGGLTNALQRAVERGCESMQIFNQSPRMWRPTLYTEDDGAAFREAMDDSNVGSIVIHAVYLINCATEDPDLREKSVGSLTHALQIGDMVGADGVILHPGSRKDGDLDEAIERIGGALAEALAATDACPLLLENTAGAGATIGRDFSELARLLEVCDGNERIGFCLDSCHLLATGYDTRTAAAIGQVVDEFDRVVGLDRLRCLHVNDSQTPLGSNRDRHAPLAEGEMGREGCAAFLSEPRFEGLPAIFEGPGLEGKAPQISDVERMRELRETGLAARGREAGC